MMWSDGKAVARRAEAQLDEGCAFLLLFFTASIVGWIWEAGAYWFLKDFQLSPLTLLANYRGVLHGLWVPIYPFRTNSEIGFLR